MYCPSCGTQNSEVNRFCLKCGTALPSITPPPAAIPHHSSATSIAQNARTKQWIVVGVVAVVVLLVIAVIASQTGPWKPSKPGVYLQAGRTELHRERTMDPQQQGLPQTGEKQPTLLVYLPGEDTQYLQFMRISGGKANLGFNTLTYENGVYTIQPVNSLPTGAYCVVLGGPFMMPTDVSWWCFAVSS